MALVPNQIALALGPPDSLQVHQVVQDGSKCQAPAAPREQREFDRLASSWLVCLPRKTAAGLFRFRVRYRR